MPTKLDTPSAKMVMEKIVTLIAESPEQALTEREISQALKQGNTVTLEYLRHLRDQDVVRVLHSKKERGAGRMPYRYTLGDVKDVAVTPATNRASKSAAPVDPMRQFLFGHLR